MLFSNRPCINNEHNPSEQAWPRACRDNKGDCARSDLWISLSNRDSSNITSFTNGCLRLNNTALTIQRYDHNRCGRMICPEALQTLGQHLEFRSTLLSRLQHCTDTQTG